MDKQTNKTQEITVYTQIGKHSAVKSDELLLNTRWINLKAQHQVKEIRPNDMIYTSIYVNSRKGTHIETELDHSFPGAGG